MMNEDLEQQVMDAFWEECQQQAKQHEAKEQALNELLATCREIVQAEDEERLPSLVHNLRRTLSKLKDVL